MRNSAKQCIPGLAIRSQDLSVDEGVFGLLVGQITPMRKGANRPDKREVTGSTPVPTTGMDRGQERLSPREGHDKYFLDDASTGYLLPTR
jgi:hypothetical protein